MVNVAKKTIEYKKQGLRVYITIIMVLCVILLSGCQKEEQITNTMSQDEEIVDKIINENNLSFQSSFIQLCYEYSLTQLSNEYIYAYSNIESQEMFIYKLNKHSGEIINKYFLNIDFDNLYLTDFAIDSEETIYAICCNYLENFNNAEILIKCNDEEKFEGYEVIFDDLYPETYTVFKDLIPGENGELYIWLETCVPITEAGLSKEQLKNYDLTINGYCNVDRIYVVNSEMEITFYEQVPSIQGEKLEGIFLDRSNVLIALISDEEGLKTEKLNINSAKFEGEKIITHEQFKEINLTNSTMNGFVFSYEGILYKYDNRTNKVEMVLKLADYGINPETVMCMNINENMIEVIDNYKNGNVSEYILLSKGKNEKTVLKLGTLQVSSNLQEVVTSYNRYSYDSRVEIISYLDETQDFDAGLNKLNMDIITGKGPDIIETSLLNRSIYANKNIFVDLNYYLQNDISLGFNEIISSVLLSCEVDGYLYSLAPSVQIYTIFGKRSVLGNKCGISLTEFIELLENHGKDLNAIDGFYADEPVLTTLCNFCMNDFIDWENKLCDFNCIQFKDVMRFSKMYKEGYIEGSRSKGIKNDEIIMTIGIISDVSDYQIQKALFNEDLTFIGYPVEDGSGTALGFRNDQLAINQASCSKDLAWEFIKYYIQNGYNGEGFPIIKALFDKEMERVKTEQFVETMDNDMVEVPSKTYADLDAYIEVYAASQEDCEVVTELIMKADSFYEYNTDIMNIINEEAQAYFENSKSLDDVIKIIQNRVGLYLKE